MKVTQQKGLHNAENHMTTTHLAIYPKKRIAIAKTWVHLWQPHASITAKGMHADFKKNTITLLAQVKSTYVPK